MVNLMMLLIRSFSILAMLASVPVNAQTAGSDLTQLMSMYPNCSLTCMTDLIPSSSCVSTSGINQTCLCTNEQLNAQITICASQSCTVRELLTTKNASSTICGAEIRDHSSNMTVIGLTLGGIAGLVFIIRIIARLTMHQKRLFADDWTMLLMVAVAIPPTVFAPLLAANGLGKDMWTLPFGHINNVLEFFFIGEICYLVALAINKISILCFFLRIFPKRELRGTIYGVMGVCAAYGIAFFFATLFQCHPITYVWHQWDDQYKGSCNNFHVQGWVAGGVNMVLDLVVIILPLPELAKMNMSKRKKFSVMLMFLTGLFVTAVSAVRLKYLVQFRHTQNPTYDYLAPGYWSVIELHVGIICASMPAIYSLIQAFWPRLVSGTSRGHSKPSKALSSGNSDSRFTPVSSRNKGLNTDDFVPLRDLDGDAATLNTQSSRTHLKAYQG